MENLSKIPLGKKQELEFLRYDVLPCIVFGATLVTTCFFYYKHIKPERHLHLFSEKERVCECGNLETNYLSNKKQMVK